MVLNSTDRERLAKLLAMFSSSHDGEVVNAARLAERMVKLKGETWMNIICAPPVAHKPDKPQPPPDVPTWKDDVRECAKFQAHLNEWEKEFINSLLSKLSKYPLTTRQRMALDTIKEKISKIKDMDW